VGRLVDATQEKSREWRPEWMIQLDDELREEKGNRKLFDGVSCVRNERVDVWGEKGKEKTGSIPTLPLGTAVGNVKS